MLELKTFKVKSAVVDLFYSENVRRSKGTFNYQWSLWIDDYPWEQFSP